MRSGTQQDPGQDPPSSLHSLAFSGVCSCRLLAKATRRKPPSHLLQAALKEAQASWRGRPGVDS